MVGEDPPQLRRNRRSTLVLAAVEPDDLAVLVEGSREGLAAAPVPAVENAFVQRSKVGLHLLRLAHRGPPRSPSLGFGAG